MASAKRFSFITKYFVVMMAMAIVPNDIMSSLVDANDSPIIAFEEGKDVKERMPEGRQLCITMIEVVNRIIIKIDEAFRKLKHFLHEILSYRM